MTLIDVDGFTWTDQRLNLPVHDTAAVPGFEIEIREIRYDAPDTRPTSWRWRVASTADASMHAEGPALRRDSAVEHAKQALQLFRTIQWVLK